MMFESRPRSAGLTFALSVGGLQLVDKLTEHSLFPCLVGSQNKVSGKEERSKLYAEDRKCYLAVRKLICKSTFSMLAHGV